MIDHAMAVKESAGILLYRLAAGRVEVLIGHMGGPYWARKDAAGWSIPKGEFEPGDDPLTAAKREFEEEIGRPVPATDFVELGTHKQSTGKLVTVWAALGDLDASTASSNTFEMEWPKGSGRIEAFPEIDRADWFDLETAREKLVKGQRPFLEDLAERLDTERANTEPANTEPRSTERPRKNG
jgi:predicted NUDIX family NTP pyrophosphohydrolase